MITYTTGRIGAGKQVHYIQHDGNYILCGAGAGRQTSIKRYQRKARIKTTGEAVTCQRCQQIASRVSA